MYSYVHALYRYTYVFTLYRYTFVYALNRYTSVYKYALSIHVLNFKYRN